jgi:hypothetical protein
MGMSPPVGFTNRKAHTWQTIYHKHNYNFAGGRFF